MLIGRWGTLPLRFHRLPFSRAALIGVVAVLAVTQLLFVGDAVVRARFSDSSADASTRIYARPLVLTAGGTAQRERVKRYLDRLGYQHVTSRRSVGPGDYRLSGNRWEIGRRSFRHFDRLEPAQLVDIRVGYDDRVWSMRTEDGRAIDQFVLEPELLRSPLDVASQLRLPVPLAAVPDHLIDAVLSIEDQRFFRHGGVDMRRVAGAAVANAKAGGVVQGGSTLTQQLAKNLFLSPRRSPVRKWREVLMAVVLESRYSKEEILAKYLNEVYMGQEGGRAVHGVGMAARVYFSRDISELDLTQSALLAGLIRGPNLYAPLRNPELALARRNLVLDQMLANDLLSPDQHDTARNTPLGVNAATPPVDLGRYFLDYAAQSLRGEFGEDVFQHGLSVYTTLDAELQEIAERAVRTGLQRLERDYASLRSERSPVQAALVALDPRTGDVLAMVGGRDYGASQFNRAVLARRQPGSAFKPIVALTAIAGSEGYTLATVLDDEPLVVETPAGRWEPANYDGQFRGSVTLRDALERSLNVPFARLGMDIGAERIVRTARELGLDGTINAVPSIALGSSEVTPLGLTRAFGVLAAGGFRADLKSTLAVVSTSGRLLSRSQTSGEQVYRAEQAYLVTSALQGAVERGTGRGLRRTGFRGAIAGKSGTTNGFRDAWFVGFTPQMAIGVWVGYDDSRSVGLPGSQAALPIFAQFLTESVGRYGEGDFERPSGIEVVAVNSETGLRAGPGCRGEPEFFERGTAPTRSCAYWAGDWWTGRGRRSYDSRVQSVIEKLRRSLGIDDDRRSRSSDRSRSSGRRRGTERR